MTSERRADDGEQDENVFQGCPECGGRLDYQSVADMMCRDCETVYCHERRESKSEERHLLWSYDDEFRLDEVVVRV